MIQPPAGAFALEEADHLTRIHLKLALEDVGFVVTERDATISLEVEPAALSFGEGGPVRLA
ncbi:hypothetical protein LPN01_13200 [Sphingomonas sp. A2-49]|uniref:hypothetical protein n=1 Tax=Sphingomonas sp. A2-49 TaxID=1391375 RepID=UPI0021D1B510|nr:hypothetical protein [Sphingomonas sp. A2-49]MCU6455037.1 hypothetical protein [Sphingomonas sp. A2-49]